RKTTVKKPGGGLSGKRSLAMVVAIAAIALGVAGGALRLYWNRRAPAAPIRRSGAALIESNGEATVSGKIRPQHIVPVTAGMDGDLDSFLVDVGQEVFAGQALARIGASGLEQARGAAEAAVNGAQDQVAGAESAVAAARMDWSRADADQQRSQMALDRVQQVWDRQQTLFKAGATSRQAYETAQRDFENARQEAQIMDKAARASSELLTQLQDSLSAARRNLAGRAQDLEAAQNNMQSAEVRSPVDGLVLERNGEPGKPAMGDLFEIATDLFSLEVVAEPGPAVLNRLRPGQQALVIIPDLQSAGIPGTVKAISGGQVVVEFECTLPAVKPGMPADVRFRLE
ncbi:MAG: HlyD family efflux transporter periplasmic adaptor subunit, partial [Bryobacteraceae bacterium]